MTLPALCSFLVASDDCLEGISMQLWSLIRGCINQRNVQLQTDLTVAVCCFWLYT